MSTNETAVTVRMADLSPEYAEIMVLGRVLQQSGYFSDVCDQAQAVTKILFGRELGFSPIVSMGGIHIIEGKPALSSNLMATLIKRSGRYDYRVKEWDADHCVLMFREKVNGKWEEVGAASFSIEEAKTAGIQFQTKNGFATSWKKWPKAMLFARALSQGLRTYCPDVSASPLYNPEEMGATVNEDGEVLELPKSAKPVDRIAEAIPLTPPRAAETVQDSGSAEKAPVATAATVPPQEAVSETPRPENTVTKLLSADEMLKALERCKAERSLKRLGEDIAKGGYSADDMDTMRKVYEIKLRQLRESAAKTEPAQGPVQEQETII